MSAEPDAPVDYIDWLATQDPRLQDQILGPERGQTFRWRLRTPLASLTLEEAREAIRRYIERYGLPPVNLAPGEEAPRPASRTGRYGGEEETVWAQALGVYFTLHKVRSRLLHLRERAMVDPRVAIHDLETLLEGLENEADGWIERPHRCRPDCQACNGEGEVSRDSTLFGEARRIVLRCFHSHRPTPSGGE